MTHNRFNHITLCFFLFIALVSEAQWAEELRLIPEAPAFPFITNEGDYKGWTVGVDEDFAVVGVRNSDVFALDGGLALVYRWNGNEWVEDQALIPSDGDGDISFGEAVAISENTIVVGADWDDENGIFSGSAYIFEYDGESWVETAKLTPADAQIGQTFGSYASISGNRALIAASGDEENGDSSGAAYVFEKIDGVWTEVAKLLSTDGAPLDFFGRSVSISGNTALIGASGDDDNGTLSGSAYVFQEVGGIWTQILKILPSDGTAFDLFGTSVAISEDIAIIGSSGNNEVGSNAGAAYIFQWEGSEWTEVSKITASDGVSGDTFGSVVSISGSTAIASAFRHDDDSGAVYVFEELGDDWIEAQKLTASDGVSDDFFGFSLAISGSDVLIGADLDDDNGPNSGSTYAFQRLDDQWTEVSKLVPEQGTAGFMYGYTVSIDGNRALVGAQMDDLDGLAVGSAFLYEENDGIWSEVVKLTASDGESLDFFGNSVSISGNTAFVSGHGDDDLGENSGSVYVFEEQGGIWVEVAKLNASDGDATDIFGFSLSLSGDFALIGAHVDEVNGELSGSAYVFERIDGVWTEVAKLIPDDGGAGDRFGWSVSISGTTALVGAWKDDDNGSDAGAAYVFQQEGAEWVQVQKLLASDGQQGDRMGYSVAISGSTAVLGAYKDDDFGNATGAAYIFQEQDGNWLEQTKLTASDAEDSERFGYAVTIEESTAVIGAYWDDDDGDNSGSAYVFQEVDGEWTELTKLTASDALEGDNFGTAVSISGPTILIGAELDDSSGGEDSGSAYVFRDITISIDELDSRSALLYPNPNDGQSFMIKVESSIQATDPMILEILDAQGRVVVSDVLNPNGHSYQLELDTPLAPGLYTLSVFSGNEGFQQGFVVE